VRDACLKREHVACSNTPKRRWDGNAWDIRVCPLDSVLVEAALAPLAPENDRGPRLSSFLDQKELTLEQGHA